MARAVTALMVALVLAVPALAVEDGDVLFFAPFEGSFDAAIAGGPAEASAMGEVTLVEGVRGSAARLAADAMLEYIFAGNAVADEGTIMLWFRPEWPADDEHFHHLFHANTGNDRGKALNAVQLYKYPRWARLLFYTSNGELTGPQAGRTMAYRNDMSWKPGTWHHAAATWSSSLTSTEMYLYFDGERIAAGGGQIFVPDEAPEVFRIGEETETAPTEIDDLMVFRRPLLQREIEEIYAAYRAEEIADARDLPFRPSRELLLRPFVNFGQQKVVTLVDYRGAMRDLGERAGEVALSVEGAAGDRSATAETTAEGIARMEFDYDAIGAGPATLSAALRVGDEVLRTGEMQWEVPVPPEWLGNQLGVTDEVLPPWTPVRASGDTVGVWGRDYTFDRSPLPAQITSQGRELLRGPIEVRAGAGVALRADPVGEIDATQARAQQRWTGAAGAAAVDANTRIEFDGFVRVDLEIEAGARPGALEIVVPMRAEAATLYHHCASEWTDLSDAGGTGEPGWSKSLQFVPYVWLGNEDAGLAWWCESAWNWTVEDEERTVEIAHTDDGVDLIVRVIDTPTVLEEPLKLTFGFLATPVKPLPDEFRNWRPMFISATSIEGFAERNTWRRDGCRNIGVLWATHVGQFSYLPADPAEMARKIEVLHNAGWDTMTSYYALNCTQTGTPDYTLMEQEWRRDPYSEAPAAVGTHGTVCQAASWADMLLWIVNETMDQTGTDGIYLDCSSPRWCESDEHGCGPGRFPLLAARELQKRLYALVHGKRPETGFVYSHVSENVFMTTYTYSDAILNGEQYNRKDLLTDLTPGKFRAEFLPHNIGVPQILLPTLVKFQPTKDHEKMPGAEFLAYPLLHDVICVPSWLNRESQTLLRSMQDAMLEFGTADAGFLPYWSNSDAIGVPTEGALVSAYHRSGPPGLLLVAQGPTEEPLELALTLRGELAGLTGLPARDALTGEALSWRDGKLVWPLPGRAVQMVIVE